MILVPPYLRKPPEGDEFGNPLVKSIAIAIIITACSQLVVGYVEIGDILLPVALPTARVVGGVQGEIDLDAGAEIEHGTGEGGEGGGGVDLDAGVKIKHGARECGERC